MNIIYFKWKQVVQLRSSIPATVQQDTNSISPAEPSTNVTATSAIHFPKTTEEEKTKEIEVKGQDKETEGEESKDASSSELSAEIERELRRELDNESAIFEAEEKNKATQSKGKRKKSGKGKDKEKELDQGWEEVKDTRPFEDLHGDVIANEQELEEKWEAYFTIYGRGVCMLQTPALKDLIRCGIPTSLRSKSMYHPP